MLSISCRTTPLREVRKSREISGLALWSASQAICVHDAKADLEPNDPRLGLIDSSILGGRYTEIKVAWPEAELASDLEAICNIPGRPREFLACESAYWTNQLGQWNRAGRLFRLECEPAGEHLRARVAQVWRWPIGTKDIEGIACTLINGQPLLFAAKRSGTVYTARLNFGNNDKTRLHFIASNTVSENILPAFQRKIGDLYLDHANKLWAVATVDSADTHPAWNDGPFRSVVYELGIVSNDLNRPVTLHSSLTNHFTVDGLKVEGLTGSILGRGQFTIGSDDEDLGGVWRIIGSE